MYAQQLNSVFFPQTTGKEPFEKQYQLGSLLGSGGFGSVFAGQRISDGLQVGVGNSPEEKIVLFVSLG